ncbi:hypothetical protein C5167_009102 [Papaver somniferum]|uniref:Late embryogenesis abundant protein LEA-2 subgroup domain-containing protein n=1 Tax=Papaver somniferum TaxID=3469 RepID=A0A4Y7JZB6_PAPSO|nr:NDR1/HIN1-like protein 6 [Papaver somniferum]RZC65412.1 hypothetical protein C5167_009102 [Papaver somniferum]
MSHHHRVHPMDVETNTGGPPKYVMLSENGGDAGVRPPPYRRNIPRYHSTAQPYKKKGNCCLKCICCFYCFLFILIFGVSAFVFYVHAIYQPKMPTYKVDHIGIGAFDLQADFSLYTEFDVTVRAENPNERITIFYAPESSIAITYSDSTLCTGKIPTFKQGHQNVTFMDIVLKGKSEFGSGLQEALLDNRKTGKIPLLIIVRAPIVIEMGDLPLKQVTFLVNCSLVIDSLTPRKQVKILSTTYHGAIELS